MQELPFVGAERRALVARLLGVYDEVVASGSPRLVTLEAGSGWGKSRIVRELYGRMAAERQTSGFWPAAILDAVAESDRAALDAPNGRRKRVFPATFTPPAGALPEWLWWGISATARQSGMPVNALAADLEQVEGIRAALLMRLADLNPDTAWSRAVRALRSEGVREVTWEVAEKGLEAALTAAAIATAPLGFLVLAGRMTWKHRDRLGRMVGLSEPDGVEQADVRGDMVRATAESLGGFAAGGVPVVLVLEDAHQADETLVDLLVSVLTNRQGPILIVATAWPGALDEEGRPAHRLLSEVPAPAVERILPTDLHELGAADRVGLVGELLPDTDAAQRRMLAAKWSNPLALELGCRMRAVGQMLEDGELTEAELAALPVDVEGIHRSMWQELPDEVRQALMLAVLATPATVSGRLFDDRRWDPELPVGAASRLEWLREEALQLRTRLEEEATAYDWVRRVDEWLQACHEPAHHQVAAEAALDPAAFSPSRRRAYYQALADTVLVEDAGDGSEERRRTKARLLVGLAVEGFIDWSDGAVAAAGQLLEGLAEASDTAGPQAVIAIADALPESGDEAALVRRLRAAEAHGRLGELDTATRLLTALLDDAVRVLGPEHPHTFAVRDGLALWLGRSGRMGEAIARSTELVEDETRLRGRDAPSTLRARRRLASLLAQSGQVSEAVAQYRELVEAGLRVHGRDHPGTIASRNNLARWLGEAGRVDEAVAAFTDLVEDLVRLRGRDHPDTLTPRNNLAYWLAQSGRLDEAIVQFTELLEDQERVRGRDHPDVLATRNNLAHWLGESGRVEEAIARYTDLVADQVRVLGPEHPDTLRNRGNLASWLGEAGRIDEATAAYSELLEIRMRVGGPDDPATLTVRNNLLFLRAQAGEVAAAIAQYPALIEDLSRALTPDHPDTLRSRNNLAGLLLRARRPEEALEQFASLLADQLRVLGPTHLDTLRTRHNLAWCVGAVGDPDRAVAQLEDLLGDCRRVLSEGHPLTRRVAESLAEGRRRLREMGP